MLNLNSIVVYTDLSPASAEALRAAHVIARASHAPLELLRVVAEPLAADWTSELSTAGMPAVQEAMETELQEWLEGVVSDADAVGIEMTVETGDPAGEIGRHVNQQQPDLLVLGLPRAADAEGVRLAQSVMASVRCSVLVVRSPM